MKHILPLLPLALLAGCASAERPYAPVEEISYSAIGHDPFWTVAIGDDSIVLSLAGGGGADWQAVRYPRVLPRTVYGGRRWDSGEGTAVISVEARPGPCEGSRGTRYEDRVTVSLSGRRLEGCGGRILARGRG